MAKTRKLPPGFRFHPTDAELVKFYLKRKILHKKQPANVITELDIYKYDPCDLPDKSSLVSGDLKWYFFSAREKKYASGVRMKRATESGYWKVTGNDRPIHNNAEVVGYIKTLIFHRGRAPKGDRTDWVMHEYRLEDKDVADKGFSQDAYVLCIIFQKEGLGPRNGAQYGAPFAEEEWDEEDDDEVDSKEAEPPAGQSTTTLVLPCNEPNKTVSVGPILPQSITHGSLSISCISETLPSPHEVVINQGLGNDITSTDVQLDDDEINMWLSMFKEDGPPNLAEKDSIKQHDPSTSAYISSTPCIDGNNMYYNSGDPGNFTNRLMTEENGYGFYSGYGTVGDRDQMLQGDDDMVFLELIDLETPLNCLTGDCSNAQHTGIDHLITGVNPYLSTERGLCSSSHFGSVQQRERQLCPSSSTHFGPVQHTPAQSCPFPMALKQENPGWCAPNGSMYWQDPSSMPPKRNPGGF